jgi:hypothetical protein
MTEDVIELTMQLHEETKRQILVSDDGYVDHAVWLPKSQIEFYPAADDLVEIRMPEALAEKLGLI